jgi:hypothetical protein
LHFSVLPYGLLGQHVRIAAPKSRENAVLPLSSFIGVFAEHLLFWAAWNFPHPGPLG